MPSTFHISPILVEFNKTCFRNCLKEIDKKAFDNSLVKSVFGPLSYNLPADARNILDEYCQWAASMDSIIPVIHSIPVNDDIKVRPFGFAVVS